MAISVFVTGCAGRLGYLFLSDAVKAESANNSLLITVDTNDINLFYSDLVKLNNNVSKKVAVIRPVEKDVAEVYDMLDLQDLKLLNSGKPSVLSVDSSFTSKNISTYYIKNSSYPSNQLIDKTSSGLLQHISYKATKLKIRYKVDARGRILSGDGES